MPKQTFFNLPEDKLNRIIDCAIDEFAEYGYSGASISRMVAAAGIAKGSFYQYFEDKEDLYGYVIDSSLVSRKMRISDEQSVKLEELNLTEFMRILLKSMLREFIHSPKILKISLDYARHRHEPAQIRIAEKYKNINDDYFQKFIRFEKSRGEIDENIDDNMLSLMLFGATNDILNLILAEGHSAISDEYIDKWVDKVEYILTNGIYRNIVN